MTNVRQYVIVHFMDFKDIKVDMRVQLKNNPECKGLVIIKEADGCTVELQDELQSQFFYDVWDVHKLLEPDESIHYVKNPDTTILDWLDTL